jgi:uncharacterized low-complexity protein
LAAQRVQRGWSCVAWLGCQFAYFISNPGNPELGIHNFSGINEMKPTVLTSIALGSVLAMTTATLSAAENPFEATTLKQGYQLADSKSKEGKCGEGKCGGAHKDGKHEDKKADGKCGEGKCGEKKEEKKHEGKCGEGKCGEAKST